MMHTWPFLLGVLGGFGMGGGVVAFWHLRGRKRNLEAWRREYNALIEALRSANQRVQKLESEFLVLLEAQRLGVLALNAYDGGQRQPWAPTQPWIAALVARETAPLTKEQAL